MFIYNQDFFFLETVERSNYFYKSKASDSNFRLFFRTFLKKMFYQTLKNRTGKIHIRLENVLLLSHHKRYMTIKLFSVSESA